MINNIVRKYFGVGIIVSIILAFIFPYTAIQLHPAASLFLFLLMFVVSLNTDWRELKRALRHPRHLILGNLLLFGVVPLVVFALAKIFLTTDQYIYGVLFAALTPTAIVAPFFTHILKGNKELSFSILIISMLISPLVIPIALKILVGDLLPDFTLLLFKDMLLLITLPIFISFVIKTLFKRTTAFILRNAPFFNFLFLSLLIFILFGVSMNKISLGYVDYTELGWILLIFFVQDFFLIFIWKFGGRVFSQNWEPSVALVLSASMKNIAIAAGILLIYDPVAAAAVAIGFIPHALLFTPWVLKKISPSR